MAIKFTISAIGKAGDPTAPKKFDARAVHTREHVRQTPVALSCEYILIAIGDLTFEKK